MKFAVDAHTIGLRKTGNEVYVKNLIAEYGALTTGADLIAYTSTPEGARSIPPGLQVRSVARNPVMRLGYELSRHLRRDRPGLIHVQYTAPLGCPAPVVASVHDVSFLDRPEYFPAWQRWQLRITVERTVRCAAKVITGSDFSRRAIARAYGIDAEAISVIPNAASSIFRPVAKEVASALVRRRFGVHAPYLLSVGDLQPRKNHLGLIRAFEGLLKARPELPHVLVIAGKDTWYTPQVKAAARRSFAAERIRFTGFVTDEELVGLYCASDLFVFPSFYEGFGLPVLEAMACARAVACSNTSAIPEVADSAAILFDPRSTDQMTRAILDLIQHRELRSRMERLGLRRSGQFRWRKTAEETLEVYCSVAGGIRAGTKAGVRAAVGR